MSNKVTKQHKILMVFDMDHTILKGNTVVYPFKKFLSNKYLNFLVKRYEENKNSVEFQQLGFIEFKKLGIQLEEVKNIIDSLPFAQGFKDLFDIIRKNNNVIQTLLLTGSNSLFVNWVLESNNIQDIFSYYNTNIAKPDDEMFIKVIQGHIPNCKMETCDAAQCKAQLLREHLAKLSINRENLTIFYIGDGINDYHPSLELEEHDYLFPKKDWDLHKFIEANQSGLLSKGIFPKCKIKYWSDATPIIKSLEQVMIRNLKFKPKF